ncbi:cryptochrome/photolyase family protein [Roseateles amylovorans]|uniref:DNA photolyase family protein n=1 Tax=Roseateles amylovorans TaxID=2978473 RepID=A0ABY6AWZ1_9BURK|nr:deoxyribodipyrimidine photo-lyase [Roseateles amylovorans]UXH77696.1 DNA photolyase family protein [Roseateles amylovorans]
MTTSPPTDAETALVWFRRDLRVDDHAALFHALKRHRRVFCAFVLDTDILDPLPRADRRVAFILEALQVLDDDLGALAAGAGLIVRHGPARTEIPTLAAALGAGALYFNHDDEPDALRRDAEVGDTLRARGLQVNSFKDHVVFERSEVLTAVGKPYGVFTPYKNAWLRQVNPFFLSNYPVARYADRLARLPDALNAFRPTGPGRVTADFAPTPGRRVPTESDIGFEPVELPTLLAEGSRGAQRLFDDFLRRIDHYADRRDFPAEKGPSYLSTHLRFGTISIRQLAREAWARAQAGDPGSATWLSELIWRDFYHQVLHHHPRVVSHAFRPEYDRIAWASGPQADAEFEAWCQGRTGYPLVDAAMLQLNRTGYMHNRLRMVTASFLIKDLGIDWRRGEAYFAQQLLDFDLAANNGGWQWAASSGCDAQPYFRIFNPVNQSEKFDPEGAFIKRYLPQLSRLPPKLIHAPWLARPAELQACGVGLGRDYPLPIVRHETARMATMDRYAVVKDRGIPDA